MSDHEKTLLQIGDLCVVVATLARHSSDPESLLAAAGSPMRVLRAALTGLLGEEAPEVEQPPPDPEGVEPVAPAPIDEEQWWSQPLTIEDLEGASTLVFERRGDGQITIVAADFEDSIVHAWPSESDGERVAAWLRRQPLLPPIRKDDAGLILDTDEARVLAYLRTWGAREPCQMLPVKVAKPLVERGLLRKVDAVAGLYPPSWCVRAVEPAVEPA